MSGAGAFVLALLWWALGVRVDGLATDVRQMAARVGDVDRRLARLEGWIEGERAGRGARAAPDAGGEGVVDASG